MSYLHSAQHAGSLRSRMRSMCGASSMQRWRRAASAWLPLLLGAHLCHAGQISRNEEVLIGWRGETYASELLWDPLHTKSTADVPGKVPLPASEGWVQQVSWKPRVFIWHNFLTGKEARHLIKLASVQMKRSTVVGEGGRSVEDNYRTSYGTFLKRYQDAVVERLENKVAAWTQIPVTHQEDIQVLRYGIGQFYKVHGDTLKDHDAGVRVCTVLIYLNEPDEGGETAFPNSEWIDPKIGQMYSANFTECAQGHVGMRPKRGDALLFWSIGPDGETEDGHALHTGCPVLKGAKWTITKWIHAKPFRPGEVDAAIRGRGVDVHPVDPGICKDTVKNCDKLAENDGCEKNKEYMVVGVAWPGACRLTCGVCKVCANDDKECYDQNRRNIGYLNYDPRELNL